MTKNLLLAGAVVVAALVLPAAFAQELYKSTLPDGKVVYGDKPAPDAVKVEKSKPDTSKKGLGGPTAREQKALKELESSRAKREAGQNKVSAAEEALRNAETARTKGKEPGAGDRLGTAGGNQRFTDAYWERQKKLEQDVEKARRDLDAARAGK